MAPLSEAVRQQVRERAEYLCEYCHTNERWQYVLFTIDHVHPQSEGGVSELDNLALACFHCNRSKSNLQAAADPVTGAETRLFNPRRDRWGDHFIWSSDRTRLLALTATGRATIELLRMNRPRLQAIRAADALVGRHPPEGDDISNF